MIHPLFRTLATRPELLAEHLGAYGQLLSVEAGETAAQLRAQLLWSVGLAICAALGLGLGGVALIVAAAVPIEAMPAPWLLLTVPGVFIAGALVCWMRMRQHRPLEGSFSLLRQQIALDTALLKEASEA